MNAGAPAAQKSWQRSWWKLGGKTLTDVVGARFGDVLAGTKPRAYAHRELRSDLIECKGVAAQVWVTHALELHEDPFRFGVEGIVPESSQRAPYTTASGQRGSRLYMRSKRLRAIVARAMRAPLVQRAAVRVLGDLQRAMQASVGLSRR